MSLLNANNLVWVTISISYVGNHFTIIYIYIYIYMCVCVCVCVCVIYIYIYIYIIYMYIYKLLDYCFISDIGPHCEKKVKTEKRKSNQNFQTKVPIFGIEAKT